jgi:hypothetical protein
MALINKIDDNIVSKLTKVVGLSNVSSDINNKQSTVLTGTDTVYTNTLTIAGGATSIDLNGTLDDPLGDAITFDTVMLVFIINNGDNAMTVGGADNIPMLGAGDVMNLAVGAYFQYVDETGIAVTAGTGDLITVSGTNDDTFSIVVIGVAP